LWFFWCDGLFGNDLCCWSTNMMGYSANAIARGKHIFRPQRDLYAPAAPAVRFLHTTTLRGPIGISSSPDETAPQRIALPPTDYK